MEGSHRSCSCQPTPQPQQCQIRAASVTFTEACGNLSPLSYKRNSLLQVLKSGSVSSSNLQLHSFSFFFFPKCLSYSRSFAFPYKIFVLFIYLFIYLLTFRATSVAYGGSQLRGPVGATAVSLHHSHSNIGSKPHLWSLQHSPQQHQILNPLSQAKDHTRTLLVSCWVRCGCARMGTFFFGGGGLFRAAPEAYGNSQARGWIRATAASHSHSHSKAGSELRLQPTPQLTGNQDF